jgi:hypothetical protein
VGGEETVVRVLDLPDGQDWKWLGDANVVILSSRLDCAGRLRALDELQKHWRRAHLRLVETA